MNDKDYRALSKRVARELDPRDAASRVLGTIGLDHEILPKRKFYPALARLLGCECDCKERFDDPECRPCEDCVQDWLGRL